jgi:hypothetical protein
MMPPCAVGAVRARPARAWLAAVTACLPAGCVDGTGLSGPDDPPGEASGGGDLGGSPDTSTQVDLDWRVVTCEAAPMAPLPRSADSSCVAPAPFSRPATGPSSHVDDALPLTWEDSPPSSGPHRARWARWGTYSYLSPARWLHNLEHGGVAILHDPCLAESDVAALRAWANARPGDDTGRFRWVLTPYPGLPTPVAVVAWEEVLSLSCWRLSDEAAVSDFLQAHYRTAPEDVPFDGGYERGWLGR